MIKTIVIDDEPLAVKLMANYVEMHEGLVLVGRYTDPIKALHDLDTVDADLIFLDVQMPQLTGIQFLKIINNKIPVVLTTAYSEYALESYDFLVVDYLVKPISYDRFGKAIEKYQKLGAGENLSKPASHSTDERLEISHEAIFVKSGYKVVRINFRDILYMESKGDYLFIHTESNTTKTLENLKDILARLSSKFLRTHRSFIVNIDRIDYIENNRIVIKEELIPISRAYVDEVHRVTAK